MILKTLALISLFLFSPHIQANFYHEEVQRLFSELENLGESPTRCEHENARAAQVLEGDDPTLFHQQVKLPFKDLETELYEGIEVSVMTPEQAQEFFSLVSSLDYIPTKYVDDGCYARAQELALIAEANGITLGKAFALPPERRLLSPQNIKDRSELNLPSEFAGWRYHTSSFVLVRDGDELVPTVFDLGVASEPQSFSNWQRALYREPDQVRLQVRSSEYVFHDSNISFKGRSMIGSLIEAERNIDELGYGEYMFRLEQGWL